VDFHIILEVPLLAH